MLVTVGFFDDQPALPPVEEFLEYHLPPWMGPPENWVGAFADLRAVVVGGPDLAISVDAFAAYPTGVQGGWRGGGRRWDLGYGCGRFPRTGR
jgi:hypothetical protein